ncbi:MAG: TraX family protein [Bosea sp. (in: a-proteobacteria)]
MTTIAVQEQSSARPVTTIDLWKSAALLLILFDHLWFYIWPEHTWLTAIGRAALPIFFFLIGFARTRQVPWFWWIAGAGLTALDLWRHGGFDNICLNIMFNFAMIRLALPIIEKHVMGAWWRVALFALVLAAVMPAAGQVIEYGTAGWLLAIVGLAHRLARDAGPDRARDPAWLVRRSLGAFVTIAYLGMELHDYGFGVAETWLMAGAVIIVSGLLLRFRLGAVQWPIHSLFRTLAQQCGRRSLEIYILQIVILMPLGLALDIDAADEDGDDS